MRGVCEGEAGAGRRASARSPGRWPLYPADPARPDPARGRMRLRRDGQAGRQGRTEGEGERIRRAPREEGLRLGRAGRRGRRPSRRTASLCSDLRDRPPDRPSGGTRTDLPAEPGSTRSRRRCVAPAAPPARAQATYSRTMRHIPPFHIHTRSESASWQSSGLATGASPLGAGLAWPAGTA
jgi:hypothetical protein